MPHVHVIMYERFVHLCVCRFFVCVPQRGVVFLDMSPWLLFGCLLMWINRWRSVSRSHRAFLPQPQRTRAFVRFRSGLCAPSPTKGRFLIQPKVKRWWPRKGWGGSDRGWSKRANCSHLGHFPLWGGQREHSGTHWMPAPPTRLRLSSKASNAHFRVSAWSTVYTTPGCADWVNMDVHNRPNVWKKAGHTALGQSQWVSELLSIVSHSFFMSPGPNASCRAAGKTDGQFSRTR